MIYNSKNIACVCALALVGMTPGSCQVSSQSKNARLLQDAAQSIGSGNLERAERELQSILRIYPDDFRALDFLGIVRAQQKREYEAERMFRAAERAQPDFASAHVHLGLLYMQINRLDDAIGELQRSLGLDPTRNDASTALARIWQGQARAAVEAGDSEKALSLLIQSRKLAPDDPEVQFDFGMAALKMSLPSDAVDGFQHALELRDDYAPALYGLGRAFMELNRFEDSRQQFARYAKMHPGDASGHYALGMTLAALQRSPEARSEFEKSIAISPVQTESYFQLGVLDLESADLVSAARNLQRVLDRDAKHAGALAALGRVEFERRKYAEAADLLQRAISNDDLLREAHYYLGLTYARMGQKQESDMQLQVATRIEHSQAERQRTIFKIADPVSGEPSQPPQN